MLQNILFAKDYLSEKALGNFNDKLHPSKLPLNNTARSSFTYQLKVNNFKTERYGHKPLEQPPKDIKKKRPNDEEIRP